MTLYIGINYYYYKAKYDLGLHNLQCLNSNFIAHLYYVLIHLPHVGGAIIFKYKLKLTWVGFS